MEGESKLHTSCIVYSQEITFPCHSADFNCGFGIDAACLHWFVRVREWIPWNEIEMQREIESERIISLTEYSSSSRHAEYRIQMVNVQGVCLCMFMSTCG